MLCLKLCCEWRCHRKYFIATDRQAGGGSGRRHTHTHTRRCTYRIIIYVCSRRAVNFNFLFELFHTFHDNLCTVPAIQAPDVSTSHARLFTFVIVVVVVVGCRWVLSSFPCNIVTVFFFTCNSISLPSCSSEWNNLIKRLMRKFCHTGPLSTHVSTCERHRVHAHISCFSQ